MKFIKTTYKDGLPVRERVDFQSADSVREMMEKRFKDPDVCSIDETTHANGVTIFTIRVNKGAVLMSLKREPVNSTPELFSNVNNT